YTLSLLPSQHPARTEIYTLSLHDALPIYEYVDEAVGHMEKNAEGRLAITRVTLRLRLKFSGDKQPTAQEIEEMNHMAHEQCFIANSVKTEITIEAQT